MTSGGDGIGRALREVMAIAWFLIGAISVLILGSLMPSDDATAEDIVRKRYARGEIDRSTYERMLADVHEPPPLLGR